jgi:UDP-N-acetylmuramate--alanine ligase
VVGGPAKEMARVLADVLQDGDLLLVMGAGDIGQLATELAANGFNGGKQ